MFLHQPRFGYFLLAIRLAELKQHCPARDSAIVSIREPNWRVCVLE